jgi:hypothetical protein
MRRGISPSQLRSCITAQAMRAVLFSYSLRFGATGHALTVRRHENWGICKCHSGVLLRHSHVGRDGDLRVRQWACDLPYTRFSLYPLEPQRAVRLANFSYRAADLVGSQPLIIPAWVNAMSSRARAPSPGRRLFWAGLGISPLARAEARTHAAPAQPFVEQSCETSTFATPSIPHASEGGFKLLDEHNFVAKRRAFDTRTQGRTSLCQSR